MMGKFTIWLDFGSKGRVGGQRFSGRRTAEELNYVKSLYTLQRDAWAQEKRKRNTAWSLGKEETRSVSSLRNQGDVCGRRRGVRHLQGPEQSYKDRKWLPGQADWMAGGVGKTPPGRLSWQSTKLRRMKKFLTQPPTVILATIFLDFSYTSPQLGQIPLSRLRKWVARNRREQRFRVSLICSLFESQITSKCNSPAKRQEIALPAATAHSRWDESVGPQGSRFQQSRPRGCHCLGEIETVWSSRVFTPSRPRPALSCRDSFPWGVAWCWLGRSGRKPSVWTIW